MDSYDFYDVYLRELLIDVNRTPERFRTSKCHKSNL